MCAKSASRLCECCAPSRTPPPDTIRRTSGIVGGAAHHEPELRGLVDDLVEGDRGEVGELELDHGTEPGERGADPAADEAALGQRRVPDPLGAVALVEALGRPEEAADRADVLAHHDHVRVGVQLELERLADRRHEAERPVAVGGRRGMAPMRGEAPTGAGRRDRRPRRRAPSSIAVSTSASTSLPDRRGPVVVEHARARGAPARAAGSGRAAPTPRAPPGRARPAGSRASSAACGGTSSSRGRTGRRRPAPRRAPAPPRPRPPAGRCRRRPRRGIP